MPDSWVRNAAFAAIVVIAWGMTKYVKHCTWVSSEAYSSPSIVLIANTPDGGRVIFDDYRYVLWRCVLWMCVVDV